MGCASPAGTAEPARPLSRPCGTCCSAGLVPNLETLGYSRMSLRDRVLTQFTSVFCTQILVALDMNVRAPENRRCAPSRTRSPCPAWDRTPRKPSSWPTPASDPPEAASALAKARSIPWKHDILTLLGSVIWQDTGPATSPRLLSPDRIGNEDRPPSCSPSSTRANLRFDPSPIPVRQRPSVVAMPGSQCINVNRAT